MGQIPCPRDCPRRTVTCKFDGTCGSYKEFYDRNREADAQRRKADVMNEYEAGRCRRIARDRAKRRYR